MFRKFLVRSELIVIRFKVFFLGNFRYLLKNHLVCCLVLEYGDLPEPWIRDLTNDSVVFRYVSLAYVLLL